MSNQRPESSSKRDSSARKDAAVSPTLSPEAQKLARGNNARTNPSRGALTDDHPERLKQATEGMDDVEDDKITGEKLFGTPSPGPARSPGSEH